MTLFQEFKSFIMRGNALDMAVGIIIGVAFGKVISSLVSDIIMPPLGLLIGGVDFSNLSIPLKKGNPPIAITYGAFLNAIIDFLIISAAIFLVIKLTNKIIKKKKGTTKECPECCMSIPAQAKRCGHCTHSLIGNK